MKYRLIVIANLGFIIGILLGLYFKVSIILFLSIFVVGVAFWLYNKYVLEKKSKLQKKSVWILKKLYRYLKVYISKKVVIVFVVFVVLGYLLLVCKDIKFEKFYEDMNMCILSGNASGYGVIVSDKEDKEYSDVYRIKLLEVNGISYSNVYCFLKLKKQSDSVVKYGDLVRFEGEFQEPQNRTNFKGFSYKEYLKTINVYGTFSSTYNKVAVLRENCLSWAFLMSNKVKLSFERTN